MGESETKAEQFAEIGESPSLLDIFLSDNFFYFNII